ncbi:MAG TPA: glycosyltransferase family 1 protein [bacterium]|nr:glycosyltransferase family 1 protein [bacterium]
MPNKRLAIFATHPIQYQVPIWKQLASTEGLEVVVHYLSDHSIKGGLDKGFGVEVTWDVPLLEGYEYRFIERDTDFTKKHKVKIPNVRGLLTEGKFDSVLIQGYTHKFERDVVVEAKRLGIRTILRAELSDSAKKRGLIKQLLRDAYLWWFYRHIDAFCRVGEQAGKHLQRRGIDNKKIFFSPYSIDSEFFESQKKLFDRNAIRQKLSFNDDSIVLLFCGKLIDCKNPFLLIEAIEKISYKNIHLIIVGDGPLRRDFEQRARLVLGDRLLMAGFVNQTQLGKYYCASNIFILPSKSETWGLVVNEAMLFGLPAIVSDNVGCHSDLIIEDQTGFVFENNNVDSLSEAIMKIVQNKRLLLQMGNNSAEHIKNYSTQASVKGILDALAMNH